MNTSPKSPVAFVSTVPFGQTSSGPVDALRAAGVDLRINPYGRKIRPDELPQHLGEVAYLIAGTERLTPAILDHAPHLRLIARVGIGLDGIDFDYCNERGIQVSYTPDAPTIAVAELIVGLVLDRLRLISTADRELREGRWNKFMGRQLRGLTLGFLGFGRIGKTAARLMQPFRAQLQACDPVWDLATARLLETTRVDFETLLRTSDVLCLCLPLNDETVHIIGAPQLSAMKPGSVLINTARGGIVDEDALLAALEAGPLSSAAVDVFEQEPYDGPLRHHPEVLSTCHMGAATRTSRVLMEQRAVDEVLRFLRGQALVNPVFSNK